MTEWTTITVTPEMRDRLKSLKRGGESYAEMFDRLIEEAGVEPQTDDETEAPADA